MKTSLHCCFRTVFLVTCMEITLWLYLKKSYLPSRAMSDSQLSAEVETDVASSCPNRPLDILVLVLTRPTSFKRRKTIRETWMQEYSPEMVNATVTVKFTVGTLNLDNNTLNSLKSEQQEHGDILFLENVEDSYSNLVRKILSALKWVDQNLEFDYVIKTDDDVYLRIEQISKALWQMGCEELLYWGYFMQGSPSLYGRYAENKWSLCPKYLPYGCGGGYIISQKIVNASMQYSDKLSLYNNEDVTVGAWLAPYRVARVHDARFDVMGVPRDRGCRNNYLMTHRKEDDSYFYEQHARFLRKKEFCEKEVEWSDPYQGQRTWWDWFLKW